MRKRRLVLEAGRAETRYWQDLWDYRELFVILAWRDICVRYKQAAIGVLWAILRPTLTMAVFTVVFAHVAGLPSVGSVPYPLMVLAGMLPWLLFSTIVVEAANSLVANEALVGKVYFPRLIIPAAVAMASLADFLVGLGLLVLMMAWYLFLPGWRIVFLPALVVLAVAAALGPGLMLASLNVKYRDFRHIIPFLVQLGLYVSPVGFSSENIPVEWRLAYALNPMVGVIDAFRWCLLGGQAQLYLPGLALGVAVIVLMLWAGLRVFRRTERSFADLI